MIVPAFTGSPLRSPAFAAAEFERIAKTHLALSAAYLELAGDAEALDARRAAILAATREARQATLDAMASESAEGAL